jgi:hypothetical protein
MCGSTAAQNQIEGEQQSAFTTMQAEAQQVFGENSSLYNNLLTSLEPILNAGPNQQGFSAPELANLNTEATSGVASDYQAAATAARASAAGEGGGNAAIPSGVEAQQQAEVANAAAGKEASEQQQITASNYATGRQNYEGAVTGLMNAGSVFSPSISLMGQATAGGTAAANTADQIAKAKFAPFGALMGALGGIGGALANRMGGSGGSGSGGGGYGGGSGSGYGGGSDAYEQGMGYGGGGGGGDQGGGGGYAPDNG